MHLVVRRPIRHPQLLTQPSSLPAQMLMLLKNSKLCAALFLVPQHSNLFSLRRVWLVCFPRLLCLLLVQLVWLLTLLDSPSQLWHSPLMLSLSPSKATLHSLSLHRHPLLLLSRCLLWQTCQAKPLLCLLLHQLTKPVLHHLPFSRHHLQPAGSAFTSSSIYILLVYSSAINSNAQLSGAQEHVTR